MNMLSVEISTTSSFLLLHLQTLQLPYGQGAKLLTPGSSCQTFGDRVEAKCWFIFCLPLLDTSSKTSFQSVFFLKKEITPEFFFENFQIHSFPSILHLHFHHHHHSPQNFGDSKGPHGLEAWHQHSQDGTAATQVNHLWPNPCVKAASGAVWLSAELPELLWLNTSSEVFVTFIEHIILIYGI